MPMIKGNLFYQGKNDGIKIADFRFCKGGRATLCVNARVSFVTEAAIASAGVAKHYAKQLELPSVIGGNSRVAIPSGKATGVAICNWRQLKNPFCLCLCL
jgi:hypothetical protein